MKYVSTLKKKIVLRRGYTTYTVWLFMVLVRSKGTYEFMPLNGGSKRKNGLNTQMCFCAISVTH